MFTVEELIVTVIIVLYKIKHLPRLKVEVLISMFHLVFFNSITDKHQHMHFFTFKTVFV